MSKPIGIDLGTTICVAACMDQDGQTRILQSQERGSFVPSVVLFDPDEGPVVGTSAKDSQGAFPDRVVTCSKRYMGDPGMVYEFDGVQYSPTDIAGILLKHMKQLAEEDLGESVAEAVITVPAWFMDRERQATIEAAGQAGLTVLKIVDEPTAAAILHGWEGGLQQGSLGIYDLGGGTFDITIMLASQGNHFDIRTTRGNHRLGGTDWDDAIRQHVGAEFSALHGVNLFGDAMAAADLSLRAEQAKITLSRMHKVTVTCQSRGLSSSTTLTRKEFEDLTQHLLQLTFDETAAAIEESGLPQPLDLMLLVGGSSKMPKVQPALAGWAREVVLSPHPDECVARGAAIEAARQVAGRDDGHLVYDPSAKTALEQIVVLDRIPHSLGVVTLNDDDELENSIVIPRGSPIDTSRSVDDLLTTKDDQDTIEVHLAQGEVADLGACTPVASYDFVGIPPRPAGASRIKLTYTHNPNGVVEVAAEDVKSGKPLERRRRELTDLREIATPPPAVSRAVVLLIDVSYSMEGQELREAKQAGNQFIDSTDFDHVSVGLVSFGRAVTTVQGICRDSEALKDGLASLEACGLTPMGSAIEQGARLLGEREERERVLVLFTDGLPKDDGSTTEASKTATRKAAREAKAAGIDIICVGVSGASRELLDELASSTQESFFASSGAELSGTFTNIARRLSGNRYLGED